MLLRLLRRQYTWLRTAVISRASCRSGQLSRPARDNAHKPAGGSSLPAGTSAPAVMLFSVWRRKLSLSFTLTIGNFH